MSRYAKIKKFDIANGSGIRTSIYFSGCPIHCKGCFNQELWNPNYGKEYTEETYQEIKNSMNEHIAGLSILGGEPLSDYNIDTVIELCKRFREDFPNKNIWLWTGYEIDKLSQKQEYAFTLVDVVTVGPFIEELKDLSLSWAGSSNQTTFIKSEIAYGKNPQSAKFVFIAENPIFTFTTKGDI